MAEALGSFNLLAPTRCSVEGSYKSYDQMKQLRKKLHNVGLFTMFRHLVEQEADFLSSSMVTSTVISNLMAVASIIEVNFYMQSTMSEESLQCITLVLLRFCVA